MQKSKYMIELRSAIIAGVVAVFVAAPLSTAATDRVVKVVKGKQGKTGKRGLVGPTGPRGLPGRDAASPNTYDAKWVLPGETVTVLAGGCRGTGVAAGSFDFLGQSDPGIDVVRSGITADGIEWFAVLSNPTNSRAIVQAHATCN